MSLVCRFCVDWDATDWSVTPDFSEAIDNITDYVKSWHIDRGKDKELGNVPSGVLELVLDNSDKRFSPPYTGPLSGKIRPWLPIRAEWDEDGAPSWIPFYTGFISRIRITPHLDSQEAYFYCTDGMDLLARNMVTQDKQNTSSVTDGAAIEKLLDSAGWSATNRAIDTDSGLTLKYPDTAEY